VLEGEHEAVAAPGDVFAQAGDGPADDLRSIDAGTACLFEDPSPIVAAEAAAEWRGGGTGCFGHGVQAALNRSLAKGRE